MLVVIDSLGKALGVDPRDPEKAIQAYNLLEQLPCAVLVIDHQGKLQAEDTYANKSEYGTAYKAHYARSRLQIERIGEAPASTKANDTDTSVDGLLSDTDTSAVSRVGIVIRHKKSNFGALQPDLHLVMTFTNDDEGNLHAVRFEHVQTADVEADALGARGEILLALREADRTVEELEQLIGLSRTAISDHVHALRRAGLVVEKGRRGRAKLWGTPSDGSDGVYIGSVTSVTSNGQTPHSPGDSSTSAGRSDSVPSAQHPLLLSDGRDGYIMTDVTSVTSEPPQPDLTQEISTVPGGHTQDPHAPLLLEWEVTSDDRD